MTKTRILQGREVSDADIELIRSLMAAHPAWERTLLSVEMCRHWNWCNVQGRLEELNQYIIGWKGYFAKGPRGERVRKLKAWIIRRLKVFLAVEPADMRKGFNGLYVLNPTFAPYNLTIYDRVKPVQHTALSWDSALVVKLSVSRLYHHLCDDIF